MAIKKKTINKREFKLKSSGFFHIIKRPFSHLAASAERLEMY